MDNNNGDRLSSNTSIDCVDNSVTVSASAGNQNGNIEIFEPEELVVSTLEDENDSDFTEGDLSLREGISLANEREGTDLITFDDSLNGGTISLTETEADPRGLGTINQDLPIDDSVQIHGLGANNLTIDGVNGGGGIFRIGGGNTDVTLTNLNIVNGDRQQFFFQNPTFGGAILVSDSGASLNLRNSVISGSNASYAGAISNNGDVNIFGSLIENNASGSDGEFQAGAIRVSSSGNLSISNSTVANNSDRGITSAGSTEIFNSTIVGGVQGNDLTLTSSIVLNDSGSSVVSIEGNSTITSGGNNLVGNGNGINGFVDSDLVGTAENPLDPQLGELQDNGGLTKTLALQEGSVAIDAGSNPSNLTFDQRGLGFNRTIGIATDIGAYELQNNGGDDMPTELIVSTLEDENDGDFNEGDLSLREAIFIADPGATITFDSSLSDGTIDLVLGELAIDKDLTIRGLGANNLTLDGSFVGGEFPDFIRTRVFNINDGDDTVNSNVTIEGITIAGGSLGVADSGAGILNQENLSLNSSVVRDNTTIGGAGAGILNIGNLVVNSSLISNNSAAFRGGINGASFGGGISNSGTATIVNSTIANNSASIGGGINSHGTLEILNSTIASNTAGFSDSFEGIGDGISGSATLTSSIVAGNGINDFSNGAVITSDGNNLIGNGDGTTGLSNGVNGDLAGTSENPIEPQLGELQNNGGSTATLALLEGSPAIDTGSNSQGLVFDQRGDGFDRTVGNGTDIGAFELQNNGGGNMPTELIVSTLEDENDGDFSDGDLALREAIAIAEAGDTITFDSGLSGGKIGLTMGELAIDKSLSLQGLGADSLSISGNNSSRIFLVDDGDSSSQVDVAVDGLTISNGGFFPETDGGGFFNQENLTITNSTLTNNTGRFGLAIYNTGRLQLDNSLVANNSGAESPIYNDGGVASILNSTIANNGTAGRNSGIGNVAGGELEIANSTIVDNDGSDAAVSNSDDSTATVTSSIIANNIGFRRFQGANNIRGTFISNGNNLIGDGDGGTGFDNLSDLVGTLENSIDPGLGQLQNNGGTTQTFALTNDSPAIDAGSNPQSLAFDQRGDGFNRTVGNGTDIGAFELQTPTDPVTEIVGTVNGDFISSTEPRVRIEGLDGNDTLRSIDGDDTLIGGNGNDSLESGVGLDLLIGDEGFDTLLGGEGNDTLFGRSGNDSLDGGADDDGLVGEEGRDTLLGGSGNDFLDGGLDSDFLDGGAGEDTLWGNDGRDTLLGSANNDFLDGGAGVDSLRGDDGDDLLFGQDGDDSLIGGNGNDFLDGGFGSDSLQGDGGNDTFVLTSGSGTDFIVDFDRGDNVIGLSGGVSYVDLSFSGNDILFGTETLARLNGIDTLTLTESDFIDV